MLSKGPKCLRADRVHLVFRNTVKLSMRQQAAAMKVSHLSAQTGTRMEWRRRKRRRMKGKPAAALLLMNPKGRKQSEGNLLKTKYHETG